MRPSEKHRIYHFQTHRPVIHLFRCLNSRVHRRLFLLRDLSRAVTAPG